MALAQTAFRYIKLLCHEENSGLTYRSNKKLLPYYGKDLPI